MSAGPAGEFTVAKAIYVRPNSGWFSDRSVCYLAAGRPVVTMKTGFSRFYPVGEGLFEYSDAAGAIAALDAVNRDYRRHSRAARMIAAEYFGSDLVISALMAGGGGCLAGGGLGAGGGARPPPAAAAKPVSPP